jgi:L-ascorbate metabolism protein UlaG (beta-lactamase superfamily)
MKIVITLIDTACILLDIGGYRILTDPVFDPPGSYYHFGYGTISKKYSTPAILPETLGKVDLVLLSHHQHEDNLDKAGRAYLSTVDHILSTVPAAKAIPGVKGLEEWQSLEINDSRLPGGKLKITAVPARHTSLGILNPIAGKVIGFVLQMEGSESAYYISGDTTFFDGINEIAKRFPKIDIAILNTGSAGFPYLTVRSIIRLIQKKLWKQYGF